MQGYSHDMPLHTRARARTDAYTHTHTSWRGLDTALKRGVLLQGVLLQGRVRAPWPRQGLEARRAAPGLPVSVACEACHL